MRILRNYLISLIADRQLNTASLPYIMKQGTYSDFDYFYLN